MGYTFKSLCIRNFKYITNNKPLKFDFMNSNIVILLHYLMLLKFW